jgi:hypothetical protein
MCDFKDYWVVLAGVQQELRQFAQEQELQVYAEKHNLIVYKGKTIRPEDYPCECELQDPEQCQRYKDKQMKYGVNDKTCICECHRYFEPY